MWAVIGIVAAILFGLIGLLVGALPVAIILFGVAVALAAYAIFAGGLIAARATRGGEATPESGSADAPDRPWDVEDATRASRERFVEGAGDARSAPAPRPDRL